LKSARISDLKQTLGVPKLTALAVFERIKKLEGTWQSKSTKGWEERQQFRLIAKGTAVVSQSVPVSAEASKADTAPNAPNADRIPHGWRPSPPHALL
jgi:hypothetical protein